MGQELKASIGGNLFEGLLGQDVVEVIKVDNTITIKISSLDDFSNIFLRHVLTELLADSGKIVSLEGAVSILIEKLEDSVNLFLGVLVGDLGGHDLEELVELDFTRAPC